MVFTRDFYPPEYGTERYLVQQESGQLPSWDRPLLKEVAESKAALIVASLLDEDNPQFPNFTEDEGHELMYVVGGLPSQTRDPRLGADVQPPLCFVSREVIL